MKDSHLVQGNMPKAMVERLDFIAEKEFRSRTSMILEAVDRLITIKELKNKPNSNGKETSDGDADS